MNSTSVSRMHFFVKPIIIDISGYNRLLFCWAKVEGMIRDLCIFRKVGNSFLTVLLDIMVESGNLVDR